MMEDPLADEKELFALDHLHGQWFQNYYVFSSKVADHRDEFHSSAATCKELKQSA